MPILFDTDIGRVTLKVTMSFRAMADFTYNRVPYTFAIKTWSGHGFTLFCDLFHSTPRDKDLFGEVDAESGYSGSVTQKLNMVEQAVRDVFSAVVLILRTQSPGVLGYAVWYQESPWSVRQEYGPYITRIACACLTKSLFQTTAAYTLTEFEQ